MHVIRASVGLAPALSGVCGMTGPVAEMAGHLCVLRRKNPLITALRGVWGPTVALGGSYSDVVGCVMV